MSSTAQPSPVVYKVLRVREWAEFEASGRFAGSPDDVRDGFIHLSTEEQLEGTIQRHFAGEAGLVILVCEAAALGAALRWEAARSGALFPHLYGVLTLEQVRVWSPRDGG